VIGRELPRGEVRIFSGARSHEGQEMRIGVDPVRVHLFSADGEKSDAAPAPLG
jgi:hypothetical protein